MQQAREVHCAREDGTLVDNAFCESTGSCVDAEDPQIQLKDGSNANSCAELASYCHSLTGMANQMLHKVCPVTCGVCTPRPLVVPVLARKCGSRTTCEYGWKQPLAWDDPRLVCSNRCGAGVKRRTTDCEIVTAGYFSGKRVPSSFCAAADPIFLEQPCIDDSGCIYQYAWVASDWDDCKPTCGPSQQTRPVSCMRIVRPTALDGEAVGTLRDVVSDMHCMPQSRPTAGQACNSTATCADYSWSRGEWGGCAPACGFSSRARKVQCQRLQTVPVEDTFCAQTTQKPSDSEPCLSKAACVAFRWEAKPWAVCPPGCGYEMATRAVTCVKTLGGEDVAVTSEADCDPAARPEPERQCYSMAACDHGCLSSEGYRWCPTLSRCVGSADLCPEATRPARAAAAEAGSPATSKEERALLNEFRSVVATAVQTLRGSTAAGRVPVQ